jgi:hypothetical protein
MPDSIKYPQFGGIIKSDTFSDFPNQPADGTFAVALDTNNLYEWDEGTQTWLLIASPIIGITGWLLDGNTVGSEKWLGTIDNFRLPIRTNNSEIWSFETNSSIKRNGVLYSLAASSGSNSNTSWGYNTGLALAAGGIGTQNTLIGAYVGNLLSNGVSNILIGGEGGLGTTGQSLISGIENTIVGNGAFLFGTGSRNTVFGYSTATALTTGQWNVIVGHRVGRSTFTTGGITTGSNNVAIGTELTSYSIKAGSNNTIVGTSSTGLLTDSSYVDAFGHYSALRSTATTSAAITNSSYYGVATIAQQSNEVVLGGQFRTNFYLGMGKFTGQNTYFVDIHLQPHSPASGAGYNIGDFADKTDGNGVNWYNAVSQSTGTGTSGDIIYQYAPTVQSTGIVQNDLVSGIVFKGSTGQLQFSTIGLLLNPYGTSAGNTGEIRFSELAANGSNYVGFKASDLISSSLTWTLPAIDSTGTQALVSNGSGVLSWASISTTPGGANTNVQYNDGGVFGGDSNFTWNKANQSFNVGDLLTGTAFFQVFPLGASISQTVLTGQNEGAKFFLSGTATAVPNDPNYVMLNGADRLFQVGLGGSTSGPTAGYIFLRIDPNFRVYLMGDTEFSNNGTFLKVDDDAGLSSFFTNNVEAVQIGSAFTSFYPWSASAGGTNGVRFYELTANGSNNIGWSGPDARTSNTDLQLILPPNDPTSGQVMVFGAPSSNRSIGSWATVATGSVTSIDIIGNDGILSSGGPITTSGSITLDLGNITPTSVAATGTVTGSNLSGTNTGDQTITLTGDVTGTGTGSFAATLATVNSNIGSFGSATQVGTFTVNGKGLITAAANTTITPAASSITGGAALTKTDDTNVTLTLGGSPTTSLLAATSLTLGWTGLLSGNRGGTGVNNGSSTITLGGNLVTSGAFATTLTSTAATNVTLPTTGTLATLAGTETFTNKTIGVTQLNGSAYTMAVNNTNATANYTEVACKAPGAQTYTGSIAWTASAAPSGSTDFTYYWDQKNKHVTLKIWLKYASAGTAATQVSIDLPSDCPAPYLPTGFGGSNEKISSGIGWIDSTVSGNPPASRTWLKTKSGGGAYELNVIAGSSNANNAHVSITYFAA